MTATPLLAASMQSAASEIYLLDAADLSLIDVNQAARHNLRLGLAELAGMSLFTLAPALDPCQLQAELATLGEEIGAQLSLRTRHRRADGSTYPVKLCLMRIRRAGRSLLLAIGDDLSLEQAAAATLAQYQARFNAVVSHTPGLVYQFAMHADDSIDFPYLSEGCAALLGVTPAELQHDPACFARMILDQDRPAYQATLQASRASLTAWNWEGRLHIAAWDDVKWIGLRASPRVDGDTVLWDGIMTNITAGKRAQAEAERARQRLAELTRHSELVKEQERARIARELHDDLGGNLTAIKMALAMLAARLPAEPALLGEKAAYLDQLVDRTIDAVHRISRDLRPSTLDLGIVAALEWQVREFEHRTGIACRLRADDGIALDDDHGTALFRIFQEALTNIAKHAGATRVAVRLRRLRRQVVLSISDNGRGVAPEDRLKSESFGLRGMSERARALGGTLALSAPAGGGTMVTIKFTQAAPAAPAATP